MILPSMKRENSKHNELVEELRKTKEELKATKLEIQTPSNTDNSVSSDAAI